MEKMILSEICKKCAVCCKNHPVVDLSANEINCLEQETGLRMEVFTNPKGKVDEEYFLQFQKNGDCVFLKKNNGAFYCGVYNARPAICKKYPASHTQKDYCLANCGKVKGNGSG